MNRSALSVVLIALLTVAAVFGSVGVVTAAEQQVVGKPDIDLLTPESRFAPQQEAQLQLTVANQGDVIRGGPGQYQDLVTTARAVTLEVRDERVPFEVTTGELSAGTLPRGSHGPFTFGITIPEDAEPGTYTVPVDVEYSYTRVVTYDPTDPSFQPRYTDITVDTQEDITITIKDTAQFEIVGTESDVLVGDSGNLTLAIRNTGTQVARDASVAVTSRSDELRFGTESRSAEGFVDRWRPGEVKNIDYRVALSPDAERRSYSIGTRISYKDPDGIRQRSENLTASITPGVEQEFALENVTSSLRVGDTGVLRGTVVNTGPQPVTQPVVAFTTENPNLEVTESVYAIDDLAPGERANFSFDVEVTDAAEPGSRQFSFAVRYRNANDDQRESDPLLTRVAVEPERDSFVVEVVNGSAAAGATDRLQLRVTNNRSEVVRDVSAKLFVNDPVTSDDDEAFVSRLEPGESTTMSFSVSVAGDAALKDYPASLDFQYDTPDGDTRLSRTYKVPVTVTESEGGGLPFLGLLAGGVLVGAVVFVTYRRL
ncbi:COG1361 S-layer family protein [Halobacteriaceae archaeon GCM10025711]